MMNSIFARVNPLMKVHPLPLDYTVFVVSLDAPTVFQYLSKHPTIDSATLAILHELKEGESHEEALWGDYTANFRFYIQNTAKHQWYLYNTDTGRLEPIL
jgi:hypothetical protein